LAECGRVHAVVGLAAEIVWLGVKLDPVFLPGDLAGGEIVELVAVAGQVLAVGRGVAVTLLERGEDVVVAVLLDEVHQQLAVELLRVHPIERRGAAPFPMLDQVAEKLAAPADAAFEEGEVEAWEAPCDAAEEDALRDRMAGGGEMADVVVDEVGRAVPEALAAGTRMEGGRDPNLQALRPDRVVIVRAIDAEDVVPDREA